MEGFFPAGVRMMLTGQVFAVMGGVADEEQVRRIVRSADHYLYRPEIGGYRLNTDFGALKFNLGPDVRLCLRRVGERGRLQPHDGDVRPTPSTAGALPGRAGRP